MKFSKHRKLPLSSTAPAHSPSAANARPVKESASLPALLASVYARTRLALRARMLRRLLLPVGPLALTVIAGGAFAKYVEHARWARLPVSLDDAARVTTAQVFELVRYVEQSNPAALQQVMAVIARDTATMAALGASVAALVLRRWARRSTARWPGPIRGMPAPATVLG
jgi:hypothetical protein